MIRRPVHISACAYRLGPLPRPPPDGLPVVLGQFPPFPCGMAVLLVVASLCRVDRAEGRYA